MPKLTIEHTEDLNDIRETILTLAKLLPAGEIVLFADTTDTRSLQRAISTLNGHLPALNTAGYDEIVTNEMLVELARQWSETSQTFINDIAKSGGQWSGVGYLKDTTQHCTSNRLGLTIYKGHAFIPEVTKWMTYVPNKSKKARFWAYVLQQWKLPPTPDDWLPKDLR